MLCSKGAYQNQERIYHIQKTIRPKQIGDTQAQSRDKAAGERSQSDSRTFKENEN